MSSLVTWLSLLVSVNAHALPEYSARYNILSCTACHYSPSGGGPRNLQGKLFAAHGYKMNEALVQDYVSADLRALYYYPQRVTSSKGGLAIMSGALFAHIPLDPERKINFVVGANLAGFSQMPLAETYALYNIGANHSLLVGRFHPPFGIMTDEHRTYVRVQTATDWNSFETGMMFSGNWVARGLHYDLAAVSGEKSLGNSLPQAEAVRWGGIFNARTLHGPALLGVSASHHRRDPRSDSRSAWSVYVVMSLARWTNDRVPVTVQLEHVEAANWGAALGRGFAADTNYVKALDGARSEGWLAMLLWRFATDLDLIYKFDSLVPDREYRADQYNRHGLGLRWFAGPAVIAQLRYELAQATPPSEDGSTAWGGQDAAFAILQMGF